ncbi:hypothetical protein JQK15_03985 [Sphingobium sp. BHU LFT2]|uniref:hypothetical protein n=1 Tax=Sphingobium sp. BHU LFT2 TaxID=2807634 RepID=UPI001BE74181|nr:hypothetical protein [Sphingobium sp. BHU LFT2]MBT2242689.1 hypothetical protein [Sphingobium sp. BHU LFT2]
MRWILAAAMMAMPAQAMAAPTYLGCQIADSGKEYLVNFALDEAKGSATISSDANDKSFSAPASFSPEKVTIQERVFTWVIDRISLDLQRRTVIGDQQWNERGKCTVAKPPASRAF